MPGGPGKPWRWRRLREAKPPDKSYRSYKTYILYKTGDLCRWLPGGNIEYLGRIDHQVKIRGFRIEPGEIEKQLLTHEKIKEAVVVDIERGPGDRYLCAYIVYREVGSKPAGAGVLDLKEFLLNKLPEYMIPSYFISIERIPLGSSGKVDRRALPLPDRKIDTGVRFVAPRSEVEKIISRIWQEVLELERVGVNDNFFDLGGNSLKIIQATTKLKEALKRDIPMTLPFRYPSISALAQYLSKEESEGVDRPKIRQEERTRGKSKQKILKERRKVRQNE